MKSAYSIIIPVYNEISLIPKLLSELKKYHLDGHEVIIIDDGSNDGSSRQLSNCNFIKLIVNKINKGKGYAIREGLKIAKSEKIVLFDGDNELNPNQKNMESTELTKQKQKLYKEILKVILCLSYQSSLLILGLKLAALQQLLSHRKNSSENKIVHEWHK